jgi:cytoskeleton protein RodZ
MSDVEASGRERTAPGPAATSAVPPARAEAAARVEEGSFGRALAAAREARGLTQADVAAQLRLSTRQVRAIEAEDLAALPEGPFVRGYLRGFARLVDLPAEPLLALLNARLRPSEPLRGAVEGAKAVSPIQRTPREPVSGRFAIGAAVAALLVFALFGWWTMRPAPPAPPTAQVEVAPAAAAVQPAPAAGTEQPAPGAAAAAEPPAVAAAESSGPAAAEPAATAPDGALTLRFRGLSWVEVRQADGAVLLSQNNPAGTQRTIDGVPPYTLVVGNASKVDLEFRGRSVDLAAAANRDDVARLRLE